MREKRHNVAGVKDVDCPAPYRVEATFHAPPERFEGCFTSFYTLELDVAENGTVRDWLQPEWGNIRFFAGSCPDAQIGASRVRSMCFNATGPSSRPCRFELGSSRMWGIGFLPLGWARFVGADAYRHANVICDGASHPVFAKFNTLEPVLGDPDASTEDQLAAICETMDRLARPHRDEPKVVRVHTALVSGEHVTVNQLADACAMSIRTLERVCRRHFGFTPKLLMRRQRFMRSLTSFMLHAGSRWTEAMDRDYHDQAQFTREFCEFMTMTPSEYAALEHPILSSFVEARARTWGSAAQTLDGPAR
ncbi:MAG: helix-turn-helix domain-containing protein [Erythrobacter sp.]|uniref:helix-turn-helix domain-containing protein n=1 Tax=Erythrobacter sp. TaxID=1042 RepID=UPI003C70662B